MIAMIGQTMRTFISASSLVSAVLAAGTPAAGQTPVTRTLLRDFHSADISGVLPVNATNSAASGPSGTGISASTDAGFVRLKLTNPDGGVNGCVIPFPAGTLPSAGNWLVSADIKVVNSAAKPIESFGMAALDGAPGTAKIDDANSGYVMNLYDNRTSATGLGFQTVVAAVQASGPSALTLVFSTDASKGQGTGQPSFDGNHTGAHRSGAATWDSVDATEHVLIDNIRLTGPGVFGNERHLWISVGDGFTNLATLESQLVAAKANNFNAVDILVRYRANHYYRTNRDFSTYPVTEPFAGGANANNDPIQYAIDRGHELGLKVFGAVSCFLVTDGGNTYPSVMPPGSVTWVYNAGVPRAQTTADASEGLWADVGRADVRAHTINVVKDLVKNYDLDGIIFDRIRYSDSSFGYNPTALSQMGIAGTPTTGNAAFSEARRNAVTTFLHDAYEASVALKPWMIVGTVPIAYGNNLSSTYNSVFQAWYQWTSRPTAGRVGSFGCCDLFQPQYYRLTSSSPPFTAPGANKTLMEYARYGDVGSFSRDFGLMPGGNSMVAPLFYHPNDSDSPQSAANGQNICEANTGATTRMNGWGLYASTTSLADINLVRQPVNSTCGVDPMAATAPHVDYLMKEGWDHTPPGAPANLTATLTGPGAIRLDWTAPSAAADGDFAAKYIVYRAGVSAVKSYYANQVNRTFDVTGNTFTDTAATGLTGGTFHYKVVAIDDFNNRAESAVAGPVTNIVAGDLIIETGAGGQNTSKYQELGGDWQVSNAKSTAPGLTAARSGSRFATVSAKNDSARFTIDLLPPGDAYYTLFYTNPVATSIDAPNATWSIVTRDGATSTGRFDATSAAAGNKWLPLGGTGNRFLLNPANARLDIDDTTVIQTDGAKRFYADAVKISYVAPAPPPPGYTGARTDGFDAGSDGWSPLNTPILGQTDVAFDAATGALRAAVSPAAAGKVRVIGWKADGAAWLPYSAVGAGRYARAKFSVYAGGQADPAALNTIPNIRLRLANRYAVTAMLEVLHHSNGDPESQLYGSDTSPSRDPARPSLYRVDYDPPEVTQVTANATSEGLMRAFESYATFPQDNGWLALAESSIGSYGALASPVTSPTSVVKSYGAASGDFANTVFGAYKVYFNTDPAGPSILIDDTGVTPTATLSGGAVTLDCSSTPADRIGIATADFTSGNLADATVRAGRVRVEEGRQYKIRFHATATVPASRNALVRFRARTGKFSWNHTLGVGGAYGAGASNNAIAVQSLPGAGTQWPDKETAGEAGGWYTLLVQSPMSRDIRSDFPTTAPLSARMPNFTAQPGPGVESPSRRDLLFGVDVIDTLSGAVGYETETGQVTVDRITVQRFDQVPD